MLETHCKKTATTISCIGTLVSVRDVMSLCININTIIQGKDIEMSDIEKIAIHFKMNKHGYLSKYHFRKLNLSEAARSVMGGAERITSSKTN